MQLFKAHGLGNDYLILEQGPTLDVPTVIALCDRHRGPGADGILEPTPTDRADHGVRIWNPDGSIAEKSGNGLRILAFWLCRDRSAGDRFSIDTGHEVVSCEVEGPRIHLEMGRIELIEPAQDPIALEEGPLQITALRVGNPHAVIWTDAPALDALPWRSWGRQLEHHPRFPDRTNVQLARAIKPDHLEARVWERGAGETQASGSSACAVAAVAVRLGHARADVPLSVQMPGGTLQVTVRSDWRVRLEGPVAPVGRFELDRGWSP
ncbi:MAG TPA: diaminopimelate epimerase [Deltaproteobacteria bacterium]|nr:diaminopimelate epimerase [Deltaproteobacteria bacterium]